MTLSVRHFDGTLVRCIGMRNTRTGELRPLTDDEARKLVAEWKKFGDPRAQILSGET